MWFSFLLVIKTRTEFLRISQKTTIKVLSPANQDWRSFWDLQKVLAKTEFLRKTSKIPNEYCQKLDSQLQMIHHRLKFKVNLQIINIIIGSYTPLQLDNHRAIHLVTVDNHWVIHHLHFHPPRRSLHLSRIYSEEKDVHPIYSTFNSKKTCVERYFHLSRIYSEVKDVHHIYSTFKSKETCIERYLH